MGDRRQVVFDCRQDRKIFLYTHWGGSRLPQHAALAIDFARGRWTDRPYFIKIVIDQLTMMARDLQTGFGIYPLYMESEYDDVIIDVEAMVVTIGTTSWGYEDFIAAHS